MVFRGFLIVIIFSSMVMADDHFCCNDSRSIIRINTQTDSGGFECLNKSVDFELKCHESIYVIPTDMVLDDTEHVKIRSLIQRAQQDIVNFEIPEDQYCLAFEKMNESSTSEFKLEILVCFPNIDEGYVTPAWDVIYIVCLCLSIICEIATFAVYCVVPGLRDLQGKCLMSAMFSLAISYIFLVLIKIFTREFELTACVVHAFMMYFWMLAAFSWLSIISFNVWRNVVYPTLFQTKNLFLIYSLFGWGIPLIFLTAAFLAHHLPGDHLRPNFGVISCWFRESKENWAYFYGIVLLLCCFNIVNFVWTSRKLWKDCQDVSSSSIRSKKFKYCLYLKLFVIMGVTWIFEVLSHFVSVTLGKSDLAYYLFLPTDLFNCLQGVFIFLLMVIFRKRAMRGLIKFRCWVFPVPKKWVTGFDEEESDLIPDQDVEVCDEMLER